MSWFWRVTALFVIAALGSIASRAQDAGPDTSESADQGQSSSASGSTPAYQAFPGVLRQINKTLSYGASFLQGYGSSRDSGITSNQRFYALLPYISLNLNHDRTQLILQSTPIISYVPSQVSGLGINGFLDPRIGFAVRLAPKIVMVTSLGVSYGDQYLHVIGLTSTPCTDICSGATSQQSLQSAAGLSTTHDLTAASFAAYGEMAIDWQRTQRQGFSLIVGKSYSTSPAENSQPTMFSNATYARGQFVEKLSPLFSMGTYAQVHYLRSASFSCASTGLGLLVQQQVTRNTSWSAQGGPELGDTGCGQRLGVDIAGSFRHSLGLRTLMILSAGRDLSSYFVPGSRWATSVDGAVHRRLGDRLYLQINGGYLNASEELNPDAAFSGAFISPGVLWKFADAFSLSTSYGHLGISRGYGSALARDWATIGLTWHGKPKQL